MMYQWGLYQFEMQTAAPQTVTRDNEYRWAGHNRIGQRPSKQFMGKGEDRITFDGAIFPEFAGGLFQLEYLHALAGVGKAFPLMRGDGWFYGLYCLTKIGETDTAMIAEGVPLKQEFRLEFEHYGKEMYVRV